MPVMEDDEMNVIDELFSNERLRIEPPSEIATQSYDFDSSVALDLFTQKKDAKSSGSRKLPKIANRKLKTTNVEVKNTEITLSKVKTKKNEVKAKSASKSISGTENENSEVNQMQDVPLKNRLRSSLGKQKEPEIAAAIVPQIVSTQKKSTRSNKTTQAQIVNIEPLNSVPLSSTNGAVRRAGRKPKQKRNATRTLNRSRAGNLAHSENIPVIELCTSPETLSAVPLVQISLVSDDEDELLAKKKKAEAIDNLLSLENPEMNIKICWKGNYEKHIMRKYQKFENIINLYAEREKVPQNEIVLNLNEKFINPDDTPDSICYKIYHFIEGRVMKFKYHYPEEDTASKDIFEDKENQNVYKFKILSEKWNRPKIFEVQKTDAFKILYIKCAEEFNVPYSKISLCFDGDLLELNSTPSDLDMEGGECIDCHVKKYYTKRGTNFYNLNF